MFNKYLIHKPSAIAEQTFKIMKNNNRKSNFYTQVQRLAVGGLLIVGIFFGTVPAVLAQWSFTHTFIGTLVLSAGLPGASSLGPLGECPSGDLGSCPVGDLRKLQSDKDWRHDWENCAAFFNPNRYNQIEDYWWDHKISPSLKGEGNGTLLADFGDPKYFSNFKSADTRQIIIGKDTVLEKILGCIRHNLKFPYKIHNFIMVNLNLTKLNEHAAHELSTTPGPLTLEIGSLGLTNLTTLIAYNMDITNVTLSEANKETLRFADLSNNPLSAIPSDFNGLNITLNMTGTPACATPTYLPNIQGVIC